MSSKPEVIELGVKGPKYDAAKNTLPPELHETFEDICLDYQMETFGMAGRRGLVAYSIMAEMVRRGWRRTGIDMRNKDETSIAYHKPIYKYDESQPYIWVDPHTWNFGSPQFHTDKRKEFCHKLKCTDKELVRGDIVDMRSGNRWFWFKKRGMDDPTPYCDGSQHGNQKGRCWCSYYTPCSKCGMEVGKQGKEESHPCSGEKPK